MGKHTINNNNRIRPAYNTKFAPTVVKMKVYAVSITSAEYGDYRNDAMFAPSPEAAAKIGLASWWVEYGAPKGAEQFGPHPSRVIEVKEVKPQIGATAMTQAAVNAREDGIAAWLGAAFTRQLEVNLAAAGIELLPA